MFLSDTGLQRASLSRCAQPAVRRSILRRIKDLLASLMECSINRWPISAATTPLRSMPHDEEIAPESDGISGRISQDLDRAQVKDRQCSR
jgi:hypothetical protein